MEVVREGAVAVLRMRAGKANAMGPAFVRALGALLEELGRGDACAAVITGDGRFFSAGLALPELFELDRASMREFMLEFERVGELAFTLPMPVVAAIDGHAIAGGCVLALHCDRRVASEGAGRIGLSEIALGIGLPPSALEPLRLAVPASSIAPVALEGRLLEPAEARALGLVDEVVPRESLEARALELAGSLGANGREAYAQIKSALRAPTLERMRAARAPEIERWLDTWFSPLARERLGAAVAKLGRR